MSKYTPGPWVITDSKSEIVWSEPRRHRIVVMSLPDDLKKNQKEMEANAHLIASAPELLEACKFLRLDRGFGQLSVSAQAMVNTAIAKVEAL
jgi:hypothetical protein